MKILLVSKEIYPEDSTGLGISTKSHYDILKEKGYILKLVSRNHKKCSDFNIIIKNIFHFIINFFKLKKKATKIINDYDPDIIIVESLQTLISELFIISNNNKRKVILISHGVSIFPYKFNLKYILRFLIYLPYLPILFILLKRVDNLYSLNWTKKSNRHLDDKIFNLLKKEKIIKYFNTSRFEKTKKTISTVDYKIISCFGYIGEIKNQKNFLKIAEYFKNEKIKFKIIYQSFNYNYLKECEKICEKKLLKNVQFIDGSNLDINLLISESYLIVNTSITEVFPLTLVEGISLNIPFASYDKGNISFLKGGLIAKNEIEMLKNIELFINNEFFYKKISKEGGDFYTNYLSNSLLEKKFDSINV